MEEEKAEILARVIDCLDGVEFETAKEVLFEASQKLAGYAVTVSDERLAAGHGVNRERGRAEEKELAAEVSDKPESKFENAVLGVNSKTFEATMLLMNDLTGHFRGERYTIVIEVEPEGVIVRKFPKE